MKKNNIKILLGKRIKKLRSILKLTQEQFGEKIGKEQNYISRLESGKKFPSPDVIDKIISVFNISYSQLFSFDEKNDNEILNYELYKEIEEIKDVEIKKFFVETIRNFKKHNK